MKYYLGELWATNEVKSFWQKSSKSVHKVTQVLIEAESLNHAQMKIDAYAKEYMGRLKKSQPFAKSLEYKAFATEAI